MVSVICLFFFFKQKTAYEMRISDWSSDVCSSDLLYRALRFLVFTLRYHSRFVSSRSLHLKANPTAGATVRGSKSFPVVALVVCLAACAAAPPPQPFDPARSAAMLQARRLDAAGVLAGLQRAGIAAPVGDQDRKSVV